MSARMRSDRYLISATDKTERLMRRLTNLMVSAIEKETAPHFWAPIVLATKLKTGREVEKFLFKNCPEIEAKLSPTRRIMIGQSYGRRKRPIRTASR